MGNKERCKRYYYLHREKMNQYSKLYYQSRKEESKLKAREYRRMHRDLVNKWNRNYKAKLKQEIFNLLGNQCSNPNCLVPSGCKDIDCFQIDHVNGGGRQERLKFRHMEQYYKFILQKIKARSKEYQLLCANCNVKKRVQIIGEFGES